MKILFLQPQMMVEQLQPFGSLKAQFGSSSWWDFHHSSRLILMGHETILNNYVFLGMRI